MSDRPVLDQEEQRVLGSLLEKQLTVPASYPMSLSALRAACNQSSNREPVTDYDEDTVAAAARRLRERELLRIVWSESGRRTLRHHQRLVEALALSPPERAVLTVLLLRGPQAPGELRTRTERLHAFTGRDEVQACLETMAAREHPLVRRQERRAREQDHRWGHLLGPARSPAAVDVDGTVDPEVRDDRVRASYDAVAERYAAALSDELSVLPFETWILDRVAAHAGGGPVVEVGCGPGHVTAHLAAAGAQAVGVDLSPAMIAQARLRFPGGSYEVGDLRRLMRPATGPGWAAVLAWYSLLHLPAAELPAAVAALARPLRPGGVLVVAGHAGHEVRHLQEWFDEAVDLRFRFVEPATLVDLVEGAGLVDVEWYRRGAHPGRGETTERVYVLAYRP